MLAVEMSDMYAINASTGALSSMGTIGGDGNETETAGTEPTIVLLEED